MFNYGDKVVRISNFNEPIWKLHTNGKKFFLEKPLIVSRATKTCVCFYGINGCYTPKFFGHYHPTFKIEDFL